MPYTENTLPGDIDKLKRLIISERAAHRACEDNFKSQIHSLLEAVRLSKHSLYGKSSEKAPGQSELFDEAEQPIETAELYSEEHADEPPVTPAKKKTTRPVRKPLPADLPRVRKVSGLNEEERQCACGCTLVEIGEDCSEQVDIIPIQVQVTQLVRKKYACKHCDEGIKIAPRHEVLLPKSIASGNTMAYVITSKYADGLPLHRLSGILKRYGIDIPKQTLSESVLKVAEKITPLMAHIESQLLDHSLIYMDETRVQVLNEPGKTAESNSYMWVQRGGAPGKPAIRFHYDPGRSTDTAKRLLDGYQGALMTDGYKPYRTVAMDGGLDHLCCWAHSRRKFIDAQKAQPKGKTGKADMAINYIAKLYAVEKKTKGNDAAARHLARQQYSVLALKQFRKWLEKTQQQVPPKTALGKAVNYTLEYWPELSRYVEDGAWPIDNNVAENAIRPFVIGRKNWMFSNSQRGARASANLYSLIETAKANGREPYSYLSWLFEKLPSTDLTDCDSLMPWNAPC